jgi:hypothetical protein
MVLRLMLELITKGEFPVKPHLITSNGSPGAAQGDENAYDSCPAFP